MLVQYVQFFNAMVLAVTPIYYQPVGVGRFIFLATLVCCLLIVIGATCVAGPRWICVFVG